MLCTALFSLLFHLSRTSSRTLLLTCSLFLVGCWFYSFHLDRILCLNLVFSAVHSSLSFTSWFTWRSPRTCTCTFCACLCTALHLSFCLPLVLHWISRAVHHLFSTLLTALFLYTLWIIVLGSHSLLPGFWTGLSFFVTVLLGLQTTSRMGCTRLNSVTGLSSAPLVGPSYLIPHDAPAVRTGLRFSLQCWMDSLVGGRILDTAGVGSSFSAPTGSYLLQVHTFPLSHLLPDDSTWFTSPTGYTTTAGSGCCTPHLAIRTLHHTPEQITPTHCSL